MQCMGCAISQQLSRRYRHAQQACIWRRRTDLQSCRGLSSRQVHCKTCTLCGLHGLIAGCIMKYACVHDIQKRSNATQIAQNAKPDNRPFARNTQLDPVRKNSAPFRVLDHRMSHLHGQSVQHRKQIKTIATKFQAICTIRVPQIRKTKTPVPDMLLLL